MSRSGSGLPFRPDRTSRPNPTTSTEEDHMRKSTLFFIVLGLTLAAVGTGTSIAPAQNNTSTKGTVTLESTSVAVGVGVSWGDGVLSYRGKQYKFSVKGLDVLDLGVAKVSAKGNVGNLKKLEDFSGNYVLTSAGGAVGGGAGGAAVQNQNGVGTTLTAPGQGIKFSLGQGGVDAKLKN